MIKELSVICGECLNIVTDNCCECGNVCIKKLDFSNNGIAIFVDDINIIDLIEVYKNSDGRVIKFTYLPAMSLGKSYFIKKEKNDDTRNVI